MTRIGRLLLALAVTATLVACTHGDPATPIRVGAIYPISGGQGAGGGEEFRGVSLAAEFVDADGGVNGRSLQLVPTDVPGADAAPGAIDAMADQGIQLVLGSYGSTISQPAAAQAALRGMLFWETGAVGSMAPPDGGSTSFFRVAPSGERLGGDAVSFIARRLAPMFHRPAASLRFAVANVDDVYGSAVARGAVQEIHALGLPFAGRFAYDALHLDADAVVRRIAATHPDVLFVSAYVEDGIALRRAIVRHRLPLVANIGSSSSYCMQEFGDRLGTKAVGLFASDKLEAEYVDPRGLTASGRALLKRATEAYEERYHEEMSAAALAGFSSAWALFHDVLPAAQSVTPAAVAAAARAVRIPIGGLPNGSGIDFGRPDTTRAGSNARAMSVIWEWVAPGKRAVVWPPRFATTPVRAIRIDR
jgi:branched-chain amino acid transport system substrate-binding protein